MMKSIIWRCSFVLLVSLNAAAVPVVRRTRQGSVRGYVTDRAQVFLGVPYVDPPKRWEYSVEPSKRKGILNCVSKKPMCFQPNCDDYENCRLDGVMDEDCLYLAIYAPRSTKPFQRKTIMVYIHGGRFTSFTAFADGINGEQLAKDRDVIVVAMNYRLGPFGFLRTGCGQNDIKGNYGIHDQAMALEWIQKNIAFFGGSPYKVTVFGSSAGAYSALIHMMIPSSRPLFRRAIIMSAPIGISFQAAERAKTLSTEFGKRLGCTVNDIVCFRSKTANQLVKAMDTGNQDILEILKSGHFFESFMPWGPVIDKKFFSMDIMDSAKSGKLGRHDLIMGSTSQELLPHVYRVVPIPVNITSFTAMLTLWLGPGSHISNIIKAYVQDVNKLDLRSELGYIISDVMFTCPTRQIAQYLEVTNKEWLYTFDQKKPMRDPSMSSDPTCSTVACHTAELQYVFNSFYETRTAINVTDELLTRKVGKYWSAFSKYGNPNYSTGQQFWPSYGKDATEILLSANRHATIDHYRLNLCKLFG